MTIDVILGSQWGDEGKGKLTDILCRQAQFCVRAAGGHNAGRHSIRVGDQSFAFHLLPSGLVNPTCNVYIGTDVVFSVPAFFKEIKELEEKGLPNVRERIHVSDRLHIDLDLHIEVDKAEEAELGDDKVGSTHRGIGPCYSTKAARTGIRMAEVFHKEIFDKKIRRLASGFAKRYGSLGGYDVEKEIKYFDQARIDLAPFVTDGFHFMQQLQQSGANTIVEGANALLLDLSHGSYPWCTSSNVTLSGIIGGLTLNPKKINEIIGVVKAYTTRVGEGAFKTEDFGEYGKKMQVVGREKGTSTGRDRRCGWLDLVVVKYSTAINCYTALNLTKIDVLDDFDTIKIAIAYKDPDTDEDIYGYPADHTLLDRAKVIYHEMPGWKTSTAGVKTYYDLPKKARDYIEYIENFVGVKIKWIGTGPEREHMITRA